MASYSSHAYSTGSFSSGSSIERYETESFSSQLFEPDILLPSQFNASDEEGLGGGERKLMAALLSDGIESFIAEVTNLDTFRRTSLDAREWVESKDQSYVFSFDNVCSCLGINPDYLRLGLLRYVEGIQTHRSSGQAPKRVWKKIRRPRKQ